MAQRRRERATEGAAAPQPPPNLRQDLPIILPVEPGGPVWVCYLRPLSEMYRREGYGLAGSFGLVGGTSNPEPDSIDVKSLSRLHGAPRLGMVHFDYRVGGVRLFHVVGDSRDLEQRSRQFAGRIKNEPTVQELFEPLFTGAFTELVRHDGQEYPVTFKISAVWVAIYDLLFATGEGTARTLLRCLR